MTPETAFQLIDESVVKLSERLEEAKNLKTFKHICTCGGFAWRMNGRNPARPHMPCRRI